MMFQGATPAHFSEVRTASHRVAADAEHDDSLDTNSAQSPIGRVDSLRIVYVGGKKVEAWVDMWQWRIPES